MNKNISFKYKPRKCPNCGFKPLGNILYGYPIFDEKLKKDLESGKVVLGGCCIGGLDPAWQCSKCESVFYREKDYIQSNLGHK